MRHLCWDRLGGVVKLWIAIVIIVVAMVLFLKITEYYDATR